MPTLQPIIMDGEEYVCLTHFAVMVGVNDAKDGGRSLDGFRTILEKNKVPVVKIKKAGWVKEREFVSLSNLEYTKRCVERQGKKDSAAVEPEKSSLLYRIQKIDDRLMALEALFEEVTLSLYGKDNT